MAGRDRLAQLQGDFDQPAPRTGLAHPPLPTSGVELQPLLAPDNNPASRSRFFEDVSAIEDTIKSIQGNIDRIQSLHASFLGAVTADEQWQISRQLEQLNEDTSDMLKNVKNRIKMIEPTPQTPDFQHRRGPYGNLTRQMKETLERYRTVQVQSQKDQAQDLARQMRVANPSATDAEVEAAVQAAQEGRSNVFTQALLSDRREQAQSTLQAVKERHADILKLAQSITELSEMIRDIAELVEQHGQVYDHVITTTEEVNRDLERGMGEIQTAKKSVLSTIKKKRIIFLIVFCIILAVAIYLIVKFVPKPDDQQQAAAPPAATTSVPALT